MNKLKIRTFKPKNTTHIYFIAISHPVHVRAISVRIVVQLEIVLIIDKVMKCAVCLIFLSVPESASVCPSLPEFVLCLAVSVNLNFPRPA